MIALQINVDVEAPDREFDYPELADWEKVIKTTSLKVGCLANGTASGKPSVSMVFTLPDGRAVFAETTLELFLTAADAFKARHGDPRREGQP